MCIRDSLKADLRSNRIASSARSFPSLWTNSSREPPMAELTLLERRRLEAGVLVPVIRAMQAEFGEERVNEMVGRTIREIAREQGETTRVAGPIDSMEKLADRFQNGVLREGSLIVDV